MTHQKWAKSERYFTFSNYISFFSAHKRFKTCRKNLLEATYFATILLKSGNILSRTIFSCKKFIQKFHSWKKLQLLWWNDLYLWRSQGENFLFLQEPICFYKANYIVIFEIINNSALMYWLKSNIDLTRTSNELERVQFIYWWSKSNTLFLAVNERTSNLIIKRLSLGLLNYSSNPLKHHIFKHQSNPNLFIKLQTSNTFPIWFHNKDLLLFAKTQKHSSLQ